MKYLLDSSTCLAVIEDRYPVRLRLMRAQHSGGELFVSAVSVFELSRELAGGAGEGHAQLLETFLAGPASVLALEEDDARAAVFIESNLKASSRALNHTDFLVAGQALARRMTLVNVGASPLGKIKGLACQDWGKP